MGSSTKINTAAMIPIRNNLYFEYKQKFFSVDCIDLVKVLRWDSRALWRSTILVRQIPMSVLVPEKNGAIQKKTNKFCREIS